MAKIKIGVTKGKEIEKREYTIKFDYLSIRKFGKQIGMNKPSDMEKIFNEMNLDDPSFDDIDKIAHLVRSAIKHVQPPSFEDVLTSLLEDPEGIAKVFEELNSSTEVDVTKEEIGEEDSEKK